jgi:hypothetical protein
VSKSHAGNCRVVGPKRHSPLAKYIACGHHRVLLVLVLLVLPEAICNQRKNLVSLASNAALWRIHLFSSLAIFSAPCTSLQD